MDLSLEFQKTNARKKSASLRLRFGISENYCEKKNQHTRDTLCVNFWAKMSNFEFFDPNLCKNRFRVGNTEKLCQNKNQDPGDTMCANFQSKQTTLNFST